MSIGPERAKLRQYLQGVRHEATSAAGVNWEYNGEFLDKVSQAMIAGAKTVTGDKSADGKGLSGVTAEAVLAAFDASAKSMQAKAVKIRAAGTALKETAEVMRNPQAHYTRVLMAASPVPDPDEQARRREAWQALRAAASVPAA